MSQLTCFANYWRVIASERDPSLFLLLHYAAQKMLPTL